MKRTPKTLGRRAGMALQNARLLEETEHARRRATLLADVSRLLAESADPLSDLPKIVRLAVPELGDWCSIHRVGENGGLVLVSVAHVDPRMLELAGKLAKYPRNRAMGPERVLRTGVAEMTAEISDELLASVSVDAEHRALLLEAAPRSTMAVPMKVQDRIDGVVTFAFARSTRRYDASDLRLAQDFADRVALALENARLHESAQRAIRERDELLSIASHEMRTPIGALHLMIRVLKNAVDAGRPPADVARELAGKIETADRQLSRITKVVNNLLDISRLKGGPALINRVELDFGEVVREVLARFEEERERSGSEIRVHERDKVRGRWDLFRVEQGLTNLISNAIKYGEGRPIDITISLDDGFARLDVQDRGSGIAPEDQERIFERNARVRTDVEGLGLGLYVVRQIMKDAGGTISVTSALGKGSTFTTRVPLRP